MTNLKLLANNCKKITPLIPDVVKTYTGSARQQMLDATTNVATTCKTVERLSKVPGLSKNVINAQVSPSHIDHLEEMRNLILGNASNAGITAPAPPFASPVTATPVAAAPVVGGRRGRSRSRGRSRKTQKKSKKSKARKASKTRGRRV